MGLDFKDILKKREEKGIYVSYSVDIRKVEGFFKKLFGKKKEDETEETDNGRRESNSGRDL